MQSAENLIQLFRQKGMKITPQRRVILELLEKNSDHPTTEEIYQQVLQNMPDVSRTTVYNTLRELVDIGAIAEVQDAAGSGMRYDTHMETHHHLVCIRCHRLVDIERDFDGLELEAPDQAGYRILRHQVTFYGVCPQCQQEQSLVVQRS